MFDVTFREWKSNLIPNIVWQGLQYKILNFRNSKYFFRRQGNFENYDCKERSWRDTSKLVGVSTVTRLTEEFWELFVRDRPVTRHIEISTRHRRDEIEENNLKNYESEDRSWRETSKLVGVRTETRLKEQSFENYESEDHRPRDT